MLELSAATRQQFLARMSEGTLDVLVIGGGITGAGVALDAAARGLSVALVERDDFASGTSGRSSRLIHGGARYLRQGEFGLVHESTRERQLLRRLAPHLVRPLPFLIPTRGFLNRLYMGFGLWLYGSVALGRTIRPHRWVRPPEAAHLAPTLRRRLGGYVSWDCKTDDARLTLEVVRQAAARGAMVANHAEVRDLLGEGTVRGATVEDGLGGGRFEVRARITVNATGAWADRLHSMATPTPRRLTPSKGIHIVLERERLPIRSAVMVPSIAGGGALVFAIPWGTRVWAGTTDTAYEGPLHDPPVTPQDVAVVLGSLARAFRGDLATEDVVGSWAGVRPLLAGDEGSTRDLSRRHVVFEDPPGLVTVTGGKLTTYRAMAEDVVDHVSRRLRTGGPCRTTGIALGLTGTLDRQVQDAEDEGARLDLPGGTGARLVERYGDDWREAVHLIRSDAGLGDPVVAGLPILRVETALARIREMAMTPQDVLVRRTRLTTLDARAAAEVAEALPA